MGCVCVWNTRKLVWHLGYEFESHVLEHIEYFEPTVMTCFAYAGDTGCSVRISIRND